jgi:hypothetical protein
MAGPPEVGSQQKVKACRGRDRSRIRIAANGANATTKPAAAARRHEQRPPELPQNRRHKTGHEGRWLAVAVSAASPFLKPVFPSDFACSLIVRNIV